MRRRDLWLRFPLGLALAAMAAPGQPAAGDIELIVGGSRVIDCASDIARISTSDPAVVDTIPVSRREVLLQGKGYGLATVGVWSKSGDRAFYKVAVGFDLEPLRRLLRQTFPNEEIDVQGARDSLSLVGRASSAAAGERAAALLAPFAKTVVNNLRVALPGPEKQILLRVKFAELNRTAASSFGVNLISTGAGNTTARTTTGQFSPPVPAEMYPGGLKMDGVTGTTPGRPGGFVSNFSLGDALNIFAFRPDLNLGAFIQSLRSQGVLQILAEPNLVTTDGKEANFLVGGEFPVPVVQGGAMVGAVTIVFREFGIRLMFQPQITPHGTIKIHVRPEVSTIDLANGVVMSGFTIPALATRRMETHIELAEGQSFVIAGLIDDRLTESLTRVPGLSQIPVLGALFRSRQENKTKTELVVIVTPEVTDPQRSARESPGPVMPRDFLPPSGAAADRDQGKR